MPPDRGLIFDIQGYSVHDGPGCRTLVFLSGCPLRCSWCSNPEGQLLRPRLMYRDRKCTHRQYRCVSVCPQKAITVNGDGSPHLKFDRILCDRCQEMNCTKTCLSEALKVAGQTYAIDELMKVLLRDQSYWGDQGGVTFSGGEPLLQKDFLLEILRQCRSHYMHTAVETCAHVDAETVCGMLPWVDWLIVDIKHMNTAVHRKYTGVGNELILNNIEAIASSDWDGRLIIRIPIVPEFNDDIDNLENTAAFIRGLNLKEVNLLPFHRLGSSKYEQLGLTYHCSEVVPPSGDEMLAHQHVFTSAGLHCYIDSETPF